MVETSANPTGTAPGTLDRALDRAIMRANRARRVSEYNPEWRAPNGRLIADLIREYEGTAESIRLAIAWLREQDQPTERN